MVSTWMFSPAECLCCALIARLSWLDFCTEGAGTEGSDSPEKKQGRGESIAWKLPCIFSLALAPEATHTHAHTRALTHTPFRVTWPHPSLL